ncbi:MAG: thioesterase family protein [Thermodesulfobacteriota bacterium]|nr:thioesterase family protein [Thermodesulfobacteriota bacterium]
MSKVETEMRVKFHDADAAGILFFANHFKIAHGAYEDFMKSIGCGLDVIIRDAQYSLPIVHAEADYRSPLVLGEAFTLSLSAEMGDTSFTLVYVFRNKKGRVATRLKTVHVSVDKVTGEKIPLPENIRKGLAGIIC